MSLQPSTSQTPRPENQRSLNRQTVLDEDEYTAALSHIIARDFFPSLVHLDATNDYLDALRSDDSELLNASVRRLQELATPSTHRMPPYQTPSRTPWGNVTSETPLRTPRSLPDGDGPNKRPRYETNMSLDDFQARYTSEDNSSFIQILDDENRQRKEKYDWAFEAQRRVEKQRDRMLEAKERLLIEPASTGPGVREKIQIEPPQPKLMITAGESSRKGKEKETEESTDDSKGKEVVLSTKSDKEVLDIMAPKKDTRSAGVDGWKFKARNGLMFPPDADTASYDPSKSKLPENERGEPKAVLYQNTRLPEQDDSAPSPSPLVPPSPTRSRIEAAIQGTPYRPQSPTQQTFSLLPTMPSPTPAELGSAAVKQLMTWGTITATPRILSRWDDPADMEESAPNSFSIAEPSARENLSHRLSATAAKSLRAKAALMNGTPILGRGTPTPQSRSLAQLQASRRGNMGPPSTPRRADAAGSLTPAARRLLDRTTTGVASSRRADVMNKNAGWEGKSVKEKDLARVRWTPSPAVSRHRG